MSAQWFYTKNGQRMGPVTDAELKQLAASGTILPTDQIWKEGMSAWTNAGSIKSLFTISSTLEPQIQSNKVIDSSGKQPKQGQNILSKIGAISEKIGSIGGDALIQSNNITIDANNAGIIFKDSYFGGREKIGTSIHQLNTIGGKILASIFSFVYIWLVAYFSVSAWIFLPYSKTDFIKISLRERLRLSAFIPVIISWLVKMTLGAMLALIVLFIVQAASVFISNQEIEETKKLKSEQKANAKGNKKEELRQSKDDQVVSGESTSQSGFWKKLDQIFDEIKSFVLLACALFLMLVYIYSNLCANSAFYNLDNYTIVSIRLEYGFPNKVCLLSTVTSASVESQIENVLALCDAIEKAQFAPWELVNRDRNNGIRTYISTLLRRFTG